MSRTGRWILRRAALVLAVALAALLILYWDTLVGDPEHRAIVAERAKRYAIASAGRRLPGTPDLADLNGRLAAHGLTLGAPILIRIFKREFELELWMLRDGRFHRFATYPICRWSGRMGPKLKDGDHQAPEGIYSVDRSALNPNSRWHRSFNLGYPNAFDRVHGRTGSALMVHGGCSSIGCYAMTDAVVDEIWRIVTAAFDGGQKRFQVQALPFRLTEANLERHKDRPEAAFWRSLKIGYDLFEKDLLAPRVGVCGKSYSFAPAGAVGDGSLAVESKCLDRTDPTARREPSSFRPA